MFQQKFLKALGMISLGLGVSIFVLGALPKRSSQAAFPAESATAEAAPLTTWYVDTATGNDSDDCLTPATACLTIASAVGKASAGDSIQIAAGTYVENLDINLDLTFTGAGMDATFLDGNQTGRTLIAASSQITLTNLTVQNGAITGSGTANAGGGIINYGGLLLDHVRVTQNSSQEGGGGIFTSGNLVIQNSEVVSNTAQGAGGGIYLWSNGVVTMTNSLIAWNNGSIGGGIFNIGNMNAENSTLQANHAALFGGGLSNSGAGVVNLSGVTVYQNQTDGYGAGLLNELGTMNLVNVTVSGNLGNDYVGVANVHETAQMTLLNSTIAENIVTSTGTRYGGVANLYGTISLKNTLVASNDSRQCLSSGTWTSLGNNLSGDTYCAFTQPGDLQNTHPDLAPLADFGGATWTHALLPGSPAIDAGTNTGCPLVDQRGVARPFDGDNDSTATCDIGAVEAQNQFAISDVSVLEGDTGTTTAVFTVTLAPISAHPLAVTYATANGTATAGSDFTSTSGTLNFPAGTQTQFITVTLLSDTDDESNETFLVNLSNPTNADLLDGVGEGTIIDDDGLPSLTISNVSVSEGNTGTETASFLVTLSPAHFQQVTVEYETVDGTANSGSDYVTDTGTLTFDPGETEKMVDVTVNGDEVDEGVDETFSAVLSNPTHANLSVDTATGTIVDDDTARVSLQYSPGVFEGDTGMATLVFTAELDVPTSFPVTVDYYSQSGTGGTFATPGVDYIDVSGTLSFAAGETTKSFTVSVIGDMLLEGDEHFGVYLINASPISIYASAATGNILDDDFRIYLPLLVR